MLDGVVINELMAINDSYLPNWDPVTGVYEFRDWLELYNDGDQPVVLSGWKLEDSNNEWLFPESWQISPPGNPTQYEALLTLDPGEYLVVMASGLGDDPAYVNANGYYLDGDGYLHTNFRLSGSGEPLSLSQPLGGGGWQVVHEYSDFPQQYSDISYGIAQDMEITPLVSSGATARYLAPSSDPGAWTSEGFDDSAWAQGETGLGFANLVTGLAVWNYKANVTVSDLNAALQVIDNPNLRSATYSENAATINYTDGSGDAGHYAPDPEFPGFSALPDQDDFVVHATGWVTIPEGQLEWTFGVNSDDGFQLTIPGAVTTSVTDSDTAAGGDSISWINLRGTADTLGVFQFPAGGTYQIELAYYERGGGTGLELFAAAGAHTAYNSSFRLVGDTAGGGLEVESVPVDSGGEGTVFAGLIDTNVGDQMAGGDSLLVRIPFEVTDPAQYQSLFLRMKYDDGYVAYLNGTEIARANAPASPAWNSSAAADRTDTDVLLWENVDVSAHLGLLHTGTNVLAVEGLDFDPGGGDDDAGFLVLPELAEINYLGLGEHYFAVATPGGANSEEYWAHVEDTQFSLDRGFYETLPEGQFYWLEITTDTPGAEIRYTLDGSAPTETTGTVYTGPIPFNQTTIVRAAAYKEGYEPSNVDTQTTRPVFPPIGTASRPTT